MRPKVFTCVTAITAIFTFVTLIQPAAAQDTNSSQPVRYYVFNLGDPGGGNTAMAASVNNIGWIAGDSFEPGNSSEHAFLWLGTPIDLGTLGGPNSAVAWPNKNNRGQLAGIAETADTNPLNEAWSCASANFPTIDNHICYGFLWEAGVMTALPPLSGGLDSYAAGINNFGQVAGWAENGVHDPTCDDNPPFNQVLQFEAVVWGPKIGEMAELSPLSPDPDSAATAINDNGQIIGISGLCSNAVGGTSAEHAVLWESKDSHPINIGNFDGGKAWNTPTAINDQGQVVGFGNQKGSAATEFNPIAFIWDKQKGIQAIDPIGDDKNSIAWGINKHGVVVGQSAGGTNDPAGRAFIYENGRAVDLNTLIQADSSLYLELANDINSRGEIVGFAEDTKTGTTVAFLAVPVYGSNNATATAKADESNFHDTVFSESTRRPFAGTFSRFLAADSR